MRRRQALSDGDSEKKRRENRRKRQHKEKRTPEKMRNA
jgi:hypothetical protein